MSLTVSDVDALVAGLPSGGVARCLVVPASELPADLWDLLLARQPVCLVTRLAGDDVVGTELVSADELATVSEDAAALVGRSASAAVVSADVVATALWPVPRLVIVGGGPLAGALADAAALLGWQIQTASDAQTATGLIAGLASLDSVVVVGHDHELVGRALAAALAGDAGYIGAVGPSRVQQARADWLAYRGHHRAGARPRDRRSRRAGHRRQDATGGRGGRARPGAGRAVGPRMNGADARRSVPTRRPR